MLPQLGLQQPPHMLQQVIGEVDTEVGQLIVLVLDLGGSWVGQLADFPPCHHQGELSSTAPANSPNASGSKKQASSPAPVPLRLAQSPIPPGAGLLFLSRWGLLSLGLQLVRVRACSSACSRCKGGRCGKSIFPHPCHHMADEEWWGQLSCSHTLRAASPALLTKGQL